MVVIAWAALLQIAASPLFSSLDPIGTRPVRADRPTAFQLRWQGRPVTIRVASARLAGCNGLTWLRGVSPTPDGRCSHLASVDVSVGGRRLMVPIFAYADLGEVRQAAVRAGARRVDLYLRGSEGAEDYGATLSFDRTGLVKRRVYWPDGTGETTTYTYGDG